MVGNNAGINAHIGTVQSSGTILVLKALRDAPINIFSQRVGGALLLGGGGGGGGGRRHF